MGIDGAYNWFGKPPKRLAAAGVYAMESDRLTGYALDLRIIKVGQHIIKIGGSGNFDERREKICGREGDYGSRGADRYFGMPDWRPRLFRDVGDEDPFDLERAVHADLREHRVTMAEADRLHRAAHGCDWAAATLPELFRLSLADPLYRSALSPSPPPRRRPKHGDA